MDNLGSTLFLTYFGALSPGALSHFLTVVRESPVAFAIALWESLSRNFMRLTLPIISMVITFLVPAEIFSRSVEHPGQFWIGTYAFRWSVFGWRQQPQFLAKDPISGISLGLALMFGTAGLPHILMRFFTVPDAKSARTSVFWATICMNFFFALVFIIGFGAIALVAGKPEFVEATGALRGGGNMAAIHLSQAVGGPALLGFISAVAFATILAVVAGLTLAGASAVSHDLYASVFRRSGVDDAREVKVSKIATLVLGVVAVLLGIAFQSQNVAYMVSLAFAVACSSTFPVLLLSLYWRGLTTAGAVVGGATGLFSAVLLTVIGPTVWVKILGHSAPLFAIDPPTILTMPLAFAVCWVVSVLDRSRRAVLDRGNFDSQLRQSVRAPILST